jgi:hypothetical protein
VVSYAARWLGWALAETEEIDTAPVNELWRELLDRRLDAAAYSRFGWMAVNGGLDEDSWLSLMHETAIVTAGRLDKPERVAERAAQSPADPRVAIIIARLLEDDPAPWDLERIGARGLAILRTTTDSGAASDLRERLLERGFCDARAE